MILDIELLFSSPTVVPTKARETSVSCYFTHSCREKTWVHMFSKGNCMKINVMNSDRI